MFRFLILIVFVQEFVSCKLNPYNSPNREINNFLAYYIKHNMFNLFISDKDSKFTLTTSGAFRSISEDHAIILENLVETPQAYVITLSTAEKLNQTMEVIRPMINAQSKYVIITEDSADDVSKILWKAKLPKSIIITLNKQSIARMYKINIIKCEEGNAQFIDYLNDNANYKNIQEWNMNNELRNCPIYVIWSVMPPYVLEPNTKLQGIYVELVNALTTLSKRNIIYRPSDPSYLEGISQAYNFMGVVDDLESGYADIYIGPANTHTVSIFHTSPILLENSLVWLVPKPMTKVCQKLRTTQFAISIIIYNSFMCIAAWSLYYLAKNTVDSKVFPSISDACIVLAGLVFQTSALSRSPVRQHIRICLGAVLFQTLVISLIIQGMIVSDLSSPIYGKPIENLDDLLNSELPIKTMSALAYFFRSSSNSQHLKVFSQLHTLEGVIYPFEAGNLAVKYKNFATVVDTGFLIMRPNLLKSFSVFEIYTIKQVLAMPKGAYFADEFSRWFQRLVEIGITAKFIRLYKYHYAHTLYVKEDKRDFVITLDQFLPAFILTGVFLIIALISFVFEILWFTCTKRDILK